MFSITGNAIQLTRGDTCDIEVTILREDGTPYEYQFGDTVIFRMKKNANGTDPVLIQKNADLSTSVIHLDDVDTENLAVGDYRYEVELVTADDFHYTVIPDSQFRLGKELEQHGI